ncbi:MAG TPA: hypothetical protein VN282_19490 [Pyrinomonadaceae bacterium]|nr:hypothetical protein [Pyrinomonadaceae bacterium]
MRKLLLSFTLLLMTCAHADGQTEGSAPPSPFGEAEAGRLLRSQVNRERAWGAYLAGAYGAKEHAPLLVGLLEAPGLAAGGWEETAVLQAALDALIRLDAEVPAEVLRTLPQHFSNEVLILLTRSPEKNQDALLETFAWLDESANPGARWLAAGNLLAALKARGFAARLLGGLKVEAGVTVLDGDISHGSGLGSGGGGGCGCGGDFYPRTDFPPVGYYVLTGAAQPGAVVVVAGQRPVFYLRTPYPGGGGCYFLSPPADAVRVEYLAALLDTTEEALGFDARPSFTLVCKDTKQCRRELAAVRGRVEQSYAAVVGRLVEKGLLDGTADAPASPPMTFTLFDERRRKTFPLPETLKGVTILVEGRGTDEGAGAESP